MLFSSAVSGVEDLYDLIHTADLCVIPINHISELALQYSLTSCITRLVLSMVAIRFATSAQYPAEAQKGDKRRL